jgi:hypothetical protein
VSRGWRFEIGEQFCDAEVCEFHAAFGIEKNVLRLDIAVEHSFVVRVLECVADVGNDGERLRGGETPCAHRLSKIDAVHELHDEVENSPAVPESCTATMFG